MKQVRLVRKDGKKISINTSHVYRLEEGNDDSETLVVSSDGKFTVQGSLDEVEAKLHGDTSKSGKRVLNEGAEEMDYHDGSEPKKAYKKPKDPENLFADENYDQPVKTK
jgi:uncharacterized protein YlzI (FlbEa/FlbD family)